MSVLTYNEVEGSMMIENVDQPSGFQWGTVLNKLSELQKCVIRLPFILTYRDSNEKPFLGGYLTT